MMTAIYDLGGASRDPLRMYLQQIGQVPLLTREGEIAIAKRMEAGEAAVFKLRRRRLTMRAVLRLSTGAAFDPAHSTTSPDDVDQVRDWATWLTGGPTAGYMLIDDLLASQVEVTDEFGKALAAEEIARMKYCGVHDETKAAGSRDPGPLPGEN